MNFLGLCQDLVAELGIEGGSGPSAVTGQTGQMANVVRWVRDSNDYINGLHIDWRFLWAQLGAGKTLTIGSDALPLPTAPNYLNFIDTETVWLDKGTTSARQLRFLPWEDFRRRYEYGVVKQTRKPTLFSVRPNRTLVLDSKADAATSVTYDYWRKGIQLAANSDTPAIPDGFQRLIVVRAMVRYGVREDAPEILSGAAAEYDDLLEKLEAQEWPNNEYVTRSGAPDDDGLVVRTD